MKQKIIDLLKKYMKPFFFSRHATHIMVPYVYNFAVISAFLLTVFIFNVMALQQFDSSVLMATSAVIATLAGLYVGIIAMYEKSKGDKNK